MKKVFQNLLINVKAWLWALAANLWEDYLKEKLQSQINLLISRGIALIKTYHNSAEYTKKKEAVLDFIFNNIKLPTLLKPFKGAIRVILSSFIEDQIEKALDKLDDLVE